MPSSVPAMNIPLTPKYASVLRQLAEPTRMKRILGTGEKRADV